MTTKRTIEDYVNLATVEALERGGVDNWNWYEEALEEYGYTKQDDEFEDAAELLSALENGGVDNWTWYDESITGVNEYEAYLQDVENLEAAMSFHEFLDFWEAEQEAEQVKAQAEREAQEAAAQAAAQAEADAPKTPRTVADQKLYDYIVQEFGEDEAPRLYDGAVRNGIWKRNAFPVEFDTAIKKVQSAKDLERSKDELITETIKNGKLHEFVDDLFWVA